MWEIDSRERGRREGVEKASWSRSRSSRWSALRRLMRSRLERPFWRRESENFSFCLGGEWRAISTPTTV